MQQPSRTILIVNDSPEECELYRYYLQQDPDYFYRILEVSLGQQGLELWQQQQPDLVLLDYCLPDLDVLEFLAQLPSPTPQPCLPVIVTINQGNEKNALQAIKAGAQDYLIKGQISPERLHLAIHRAIESLHLRSELQGQMEELQQVEAELRESKNQLRSVLTAPRMGLWDWNLETGKIKWSEHLESMYGLEPGQFDGSLTMVVAYIHPDDRDRILARVEQAIASREDYEIEFRIIHPRLGLRWFLGVGRFTLDEQGNPLWLSGITLDISDRKQGEADLVTANNILQAIINNTDDVIFVKDLQGRYVLANQATAQWLNSSVEAMLGQDDSTLFPTDVAQRIQANDQRVMQSGESIVYNEPLLRDGDMRSLLSRKYPWRNEQGEILGVIGIAADITVRKQAEEALQVSEERFRQLAENIDAAFWIREVSENRISYVSPAYGRLWGLNPQELYENQQAWINYIHPDDREATDRAFWEKARLRQFDQEYRIILPDGQTRWVRDRCFPIPNQSGEIYRFTGIAEDITARKQIEAALHKNEQLLRRTAERDAFRVALTDALRSLAHPVEIQATASRLLGEYLGANRVVYFEIRGTNYVVERDYVNCATPLSGNYPINLFSVKVLEAQRAGRIVSVSDVAASPDLSPVQKAAYAAIQVSAHIDIPLVKSGEFIAGLAVHVSQPREWTPDEIALAEEVADRTWAAVERARAEDALRSSHETFRHLVENSPFGVYVVDADFRMVQLSTGAQKVFANVRPLLGRDFAEVLRIIWREPFASEIIAHFRHTLATGEPYHEPNTVEGRQDTYEVESYDWRIERITLPDRRFGVVCHFYDLSERQQILQREQAVRAEAQRANRIKDEFLAILSHELRSPLNPILGWTQLMQSRKLDPMTTNAALATIERNAKLQTQLIDDLLDIAKILRGKLSMNVAPVDLVFVIEAAIDTMKTAAIAKDILICPVLPQIGQVSGDAARLQQIIWNLLANAIKFTPAKGKVEVRLEREGNQAKITVSDTGKGINPNFLPHIFESFRQENTSTTRQYGGLGLGLAIVRYLVEAHGGTISADSPGQGQGATFIVQFPLLEATSEPLTSEAVSINKLDVTGMRILAVDDDADARELLTVLLTQYGAEVLAVTSATEVLANLESFQPDVLISDIGMPEVDGYILMQRIRALPPEKGGQIFAIALTAYAREEDYQQAIASGYQRYLTKPLDLDQLVKVVVELFHCDTFS